MYEIWNVYKLKNNELLILLLISLIVFEKSNLENIFCKASINNF